jgi:hypothetical protein
MQQWLAIRTLIETFARIGRSRTTVTWSSSIPTRLSA